MRQLVIAERKRRKLSQRAAATAGGISNTTWSRYEKAEAPLTDALAWAVSEAFEWPEDWAASKSEILAQQAGITIGQTQGQLAVLSDRLTRVETALLMIAERQGRGADQQAEHFESVTQLIDSYEAEGRAAQ